MLCLNTPLTGLLLVGCSDPPGRGQDPSADPEQTATEGILLHLQQWPDGLSVCLQQVCQWRDQLPTVIGHQGLPGARQTGPHRPIHGQHGQKELLQEHEALVPETGTF